MESRLRGLRRRLVPAFLRRWASRVADVAPPTWRGWLIVGLCLLGLWFWGFGSMDLVVFVFGIAGLVLFVLSNLVIGLSALWLRPRTAGASRSLAVLEAGTPLDTGFSLPALARVPLVKVEWEWISPWGVECRQELRDELRDGVRPPVLGETVVARRRCLVPRVERRFTVRCAFGLSRVAWKRSEPAPLRVLPEVGKLRSVEVVQSVSSAEGLPHPSGEPVGDRMEIRRYVPGDSVRHILWKTYARTRTLNVRTPERSVDRSQRTVAYLLTGRGDEPAAAALRVALENGLLGERWIVGCDGVERPVEGEGGASELSDALEAIARSGSWERPAGTATADELRRFLADPEVFGERHCVVFAPAAGLASAEGPDGDADVDDMRDVLSALGSAGMAASFVLGADGIVRRGPRRLWERWFLEDELDDAGDGAVEASALDRLLGELGRSGAAVTVVDRATGRAHGRTRGAPAGSGRSAAGLARAV